MCSGRGRGKEPWQHQQQGVGLSAARVGLPGRLAPQQGEAMQKSKRAAKPTTSLSASFERRRSGQAEQSNVGGSAGRGCARAPPALDAGWSPLHPRPPPMPTPPSPVFPQQSQPLPPHLQAQVAHNVEAGADGADFQGADLGCYHLQAADKRKAGWAGVPAGQAPTAGP